MHDWRARASAPVGFVGVEVGGQSALVPGKEPSVSGLIGWNEERLQLMAAVEPGDFKLEPLRLAQNPPGRIDHLYSEAQKVGLRRKRDVAQVKQRASLRNGKAL